MFKRIVSTVLAFIAYGFVTGIFNPVATLITGSVAGDQFKNSDMSYLNTMATFTLTSSFGLMITAGFLFVLALIWWKPVKSFYTAMAILAVGSVLAISTPNKAFAFAETTDKAEAYTILPNESAFWIPDVGANKDSQTKFDSEQYLSDNKVAGKRFIIPHVKFANSGGWAGWDYYVPSGRLIIVDRTPYSREWVGAETRGTSKTDQSFPCQSVEGLNITVGMSVGASVSEENAAKFLYRFGVTPVRGARNDPQVIFNSVYYGRNLADVMDDVGRKKIQTLVCNEIGSRTFDKANADAVIELDNVRKKATEYFSSVGITIDFLGFADTFTFDPAVQKAVNDKYIATSLKDSLPILEAVAQLKVQEGLGAGLDKHGLPIVVTPDMINALIGMVKPIAATTAVTK